MEKMSLQVKRGHWFLSPWHCSPNTHVPKIERSNWTIKERTQTLVHGLPYTRLPIVFVQHLMMHIVRCLTIFPLKYGLSNEW